MFLRCESVDVRCAAAATADRSIQDAARRRIGVVREALHTLTTPQFGRRPDHLKSLTTEESYRQLLGLPLDRRLSAPEIHRAWKHVAKRAHPDAGGKDFKAALNPNAKEVITAYLEQGMKAAQPDEKFQFERHGYFVADRVDSQPGKPVFNRVVTLKDSWGK